MTDTIGPTTSTKSDTLKKQSPKKPMFKLDPSLKNIGSGELIHAKEHSRAVEQAKASYRHIVLRENLDPDDPMLHSGVQFRGVKDKKTVYVVVMEVEHVTPQWCRDLNERAEEASAFVHLVPMQPKPENFFIALVNSLTGAKPSTKRGAIGLLVLCVLIPSVYKTISGKPPAWLNWAWSHLSPSVSAPPPSRPTPVATIPPTPAPALIKPAEPAATVPPPNTSRSAVTSIPEPPEPAPQAPAPTPAPAAGSSLDDMIQAWFQSGVSSDAVIRQRFGDVSLHYEAVGTSPQGLGVWNCMLTARVLTGQGNPVVFDEPFSLTTSGTRLSVCKKVVSQIVSRVSNGARD